MGRETEHRKGVCGQEHLSLHCLSLPLRSMAREAGLAYLYTTLGPVTAVAQGQPMAD